MIEVPLLPPHVPEVVRAELREELRLLGRTVERIRYLRLRQELAEGVNPEINTDKETLVSRMEALGFRKEIVEALRELDRRLYAAGKPLDFKAAMDLARTIFEEIVEDAARKAAVVTKRPLPPPGAKDFQPWKQLLMDAGVLTADRVNSFRSTTTIFLMQVPINSEVPPNRFEWRRTLSSNLVCSLLGAFKL